MPESGRRNSLGTINQKCGICKVNRKWVARFHRKYQYEIKKKKHFAVNEEPERADKGAKLLGYLFSEKLPTTCKKKLFLWKEKISQGQGKGIIAAKFRKGKTNKCGIFIGIKSMQITLKRNLQQHDRKDKPEHIKNETRELFRN